MASPTVVSIGSLNTDLTTFTSSFPSPGETLTGTSFTTSFGGKGANQALAASLLGSSVAMVGCVGTDSYGSNYLSHLASHGVDVSHVASSSAATSGIACITVDASGENSIVIIPGANGLLTPAHVTSIPASFFSSTKVVLFQLEIPPSVIAAAASYIKSVNPGITTILNVAPIPATGPLPASLFECIDIVSPNQTELALLTSLPTSTEQECAAAAQALLSTYPSLALIVVTMGGNGSLSATRSSHTHVPSPPLPSPVVSTVGAGDSYLGTLAHYLSLRLPLTEAMTRANYCAGISVTSKGAWESYVTEDFMIGEKSEWAPSPDVTPGTSPDVMPDVMPSPLAALANIPQQSHVATYFKPSKKTIGVVLLQADESLEEDIKDIFHAHDTKFHYVRVPSDLEVTTDTLMAMKAHISAAASRLPSPAAFDCISYACTSASSVIGSDAVRRLLIDGCNARPGSVKDSLKNTTNPLVASIEACKALGVKKIGLISPYLAEVNVKLIEGFKDGGIEITAFVTFNQEMEEMVARIDDATLTNSANELVKSNPGAFDAIFMSCTNLKTFSCIQNIERNTGLPVLSSNLCLCWHMAKFAEIPLNKSAVGDCRLLNV
jgi:ribokinase